jgi:hypothetical protein
MQILKEIYKGTLIFPVEQKLLHARLKNKKMFDILFKKIIERLQLNVFLIKILTHSPT